MTAVGSTGRSVVLAFLLVASVSGTPIGAAPAAGRDQVVIAFVGDPSTLNPLFADPLFATGTITPTIFTRDAVHDERWRLVPIGVEYLPSVKDGTWKVRGETMTLLWRLKPRNWHDGRPVTCADYVFTFDVIRNELVPLQHPGFREARSRIVNVTCPKGADGRDILVRWNSRFVQAGNSPILGGPLPHHVVERFYRTNPSRLDQTPYGHDPTVTVGDGPYRLVEWRRGESLTVEAVAGHPIFGTPRIKRITWKFFPTGPARIPAMLGGMVDVLGAIDPIRADILKREGGGGIRVHNVPDVSWEHIDFNLNNPLLQDVRVRRAIVHAINRSTVYPVPREQFQIAHTYLSPLHPGHADDARTYPYDPAGARRLLAEAGFIPGPDGILANAAGQRLSLELTSREDFPLRVLAVQRIQQQLRQIGIEVVIANFPSRVFFDEILPRRRFKAMALYAWTFEPTSGCDTIFTSAGIPSDENGWTGSNFPGYKNADMDRLCRDISRELDQDRRAQLLKETARIFARDLPAIPLVFPRFLAASRVGLENVKPNALEPITWNAHTWYWR